jgi:hypothetical protein
VRIVVRPFGYLGHVPGFSGVILDNVLQLTVTFLEQLLIAELENGSYLRHATSAMAWYRISLLTVARIS